MINKRAAEARIKEIALEMQRIGNNPNASQKMIEHGWRINDEADELVTQLKTHQKGVRMSSYASPSEHGYSDTNPGDNDNGPAFKGFAPGMENRIRPTSMYELDKPQLMALKQAGQQGTSFRVAVGSKGIEHGSFTGNVRAKAALTEGSISSALPPIQQLGDRGYWGLPYEETRVANFLPNVAMDGPGVSYFRHLSNGAEAAYTPENTLKPDISPDIDNVYLKPAKVAGRVELTHEMMMDAGDEFSSKLIADLARSLYNAESGLLLNGTVSANGFDGINSVSGTLTTAYSSTTDTDQLDTISKAMVALRADFFTPDLILMNPADLGRLRRLRDKNNRLQLDLLSGPRGVDQTSDDENLWGCRIVQTTMQTAGSAAVLSIQSGAAAVYVREALTTFFDPYSQISTNVVQYVAETRLALAVPRPGAICLISGLPTT